MRTGNYHSHLINNHRSVRKREMHILDGPVIEKLRELENAEIINQVPFGESTEESFGLRKSILFFHPETGTYVNYRESSNKEKDNDVYECVSVGFPVRRDNFDRAVARVNECKNELGSYFGDFDLS